LAGLPNEETLSSHGGSRESEEKKKKMPRGNKLGKRKG